MTLANAEKGVLTMKDVRLGNLRPTSLTMADLLDMRELVWEALSLYEDNGADAAENLANTLEAIAETLDEHIDC